MAKLKGRRCRANSSEAFLTTEPFEELMEISQIPQEKEDLLSRVSLLKTQLSHL